MTEKRIPAWYREANGEIRERRFTDPDPLEQEPELSPREYEQWLRLRKRKFSETLT